MNALRIIVPLIIVAGVLAFVLIAWVVIARRRRDEFEEEEKLAKWMDAQHMCGEKNPTTGWVCERYEDHYENHWQTINGERYDWPR